MNDNTGNSKSNIKSENFPPQLGWKKYVLFIIDPLAILLLGFALLDICFNNDTSDYFFTINCITCISYIGLAIFLILLIWDRVLRNDTNTHQIRLEDESIVRNLFVDAETVEPRLNSPKKPENYDDKIKNLSAEKERLISLGDKGWTEYQILPIQKMLVEFLKIDDLKTSAHSKLNELEDYSEDSSYRYDKENFGKWQNRIDEAEKAIDEYVKDKADERGEAYNLKTDNAAERLRAEYKTLIEHVVDYQYSWYVGSEIIRALMICASVSIPILILAGLIPVIHPAGNDNLGILSWGLLGVSGSLTAVLLGLRKSDLVEVGNTEGKKELWRAVIGAALGFVSGVLIFSIIAGGLITSGAIVPNLVDPIMDKSDIVKNTGLMVLWAIGAGFSFDVVFDRMRSSFQSSL